MINRRVITVLALALALPLVVATASCARDYGAQLPQPSVEAATSEYSYSASPSSSTTYETATARPTAAGSTPTPRRTTAPHTTTAQPVPATTKYPEPDPSWYALALKSSGDYRWYTNYPSQNAVISAIQADGYYTTQEGRAIFDSGCAAFAHPLNSHSDSAFQYGVGSGTNRFNAEVAASQQCQQANGVLCDTYISLCVGD